MPTEQSKLEGLIARVGEDKANLILERVQKTEGALKAAGVTAKAHSMLDFMKPDKKGKAKMAKKDDEVEEVEDTEETDDIDPETGELLALVSEAVAETITPAFEALVEKIESLEASNKEYETKTKAYEGFDTRLKALDTVVKAQAKIIEELTDDQPRQVKRKQRASESPDNVITEQAAALKGSPAADPAATSFGSFLDWATNQTQ